MDKLEKKCSTGIDDLKQYSRRSCLRIGGIPETQNKNTDIIVWGLAKKLNVNVSMHDIDRSHQIGRPREQQMGSSNPLNNGIYL